MGIYTKKGDQGMTDMLNGERVIKSDLYIELLGTVDELTSHLGMVKVHQEPPIKTHIEDIQKRLISIMGIISNKFLGTVDINNDIKRLEKNIDEFQSLYPKQIEFILPGDDELSANIHITRTVARRVERQLVYITKHTNGNQQMITYFNRLSDYLYTLAQMTAFKLKIIKAISTQALTEKEELRHKNVLRQPTEVNLTLAKEISERTEMKATEKGCKVVICITNKNGVPLLIHQMDQAFIISFDLARKKAFTAAALQMPTHELGKLTEVGADFYGLGDMVQEDIVTLGGGYPIYYNKEIIGAIGVSGSTVDNDKELARYGSKVIERKTL